MEYYLKKLGHQELGSIKKPGDKPSRGRYFYISKSEEALSFFPPLSKNVKNDSSLLPIIPLYIKEREKIYCNYIYNNDKYHGSIAKHPRDEYRIYLNNALEMNRYLFESDDIVVFRKDEIIEGNDTQTVYYLELVKPSDDYYEKCVKLINDNKVGENHGIFNGEIEEIETKIKSRESTPISIVVDSTVTKKIETTGTDLADLFNPTSFRDFTMVSYNNRCAVTRNVIKYQKFLNLEAAHIKPKSHGGTFLPSNGLALSRDIHWAFDKGFFTLNYDFTIEVHPEIESDFLNYYSGKRIFLPEEDFLKPSLESIKYHRNNVYGLFKTSGRL